MREEDSFGAREAAKNSKIAAKLNEILITSPNLKKMPFEIQWEIAERRLKQEKLND